MKQKIATTTLLIGLSLLLLFLASATLMANGGVFGISWWTTESSAVASGSGGQGLFALSGTLGQPDAGSQAGGDFQLSGGFWSGNAEVGNFLFLPIIIGDDT